MGALAAWRFTAFFLLASSVSAAETLVSFRLQAGEFMQPIGTTSAAYEPTVITKQGQLVARGAATALSADLSSKVSYNLPIGKWQNKSTEPRSVRPLKDGGVAVVGWSSKQRSYTVFLLRGPLEERALPSARELPVNSSLSCCQTDPNIWELSDGLALVLTGEVVLWSWEAVQRGCTPTSSWTAWTNNWTIGRSAPVRGGLALQACAWTPSTECRFVILRTSKGGDGISSVLLGNISMDHATDSFAELTTLSGGGLAVATKSSSFGACHLNISVFKAAALVEGAQPTAQTSKLLLRDACEGAPLVTGFADIADGGFDSLVVLSATKINIFPVIRGLLGEMISWPLPLSNEMPTALLSLPGNILVVASIWSIWLLQLHLSAPPYQLGDPLRVNDGSELLTEIFSWGHQGLMVYSDTYYFFNYSSVSKGSPEEWQNILGTLGGYVRVVVGVGNGAVAVAPNRSHPEYSALYFVTNSTPHGDWQAAVLGNLTSAAVSTGTSIVALSNDILVVPDIGNGPGLRDDHPSHCLFYDLSADAIGRKENVQGNVITPFCILLANVSGSLLGSSAQGDLVLAGSTPKSIRLLRAADIAHCRFSSFLELQSTDATRVYSDVSQFSQGPVRAVSCCGGGLAAIHSPIATRKSLLPDRLSLFNASVLADGGFSAEDLEVDSSWLVVESLLALEGGDLAVATSENMVHLFQSTGKGRLEASASFFAHGMPSLLSAFAWHPGQRLPDFFLAGSMIFRPRPCPDMMYGRRGQCHACPGHLLSLQGSEFCDFRVGKDVAVALAITFLLCTVFLCLGSWLEARAFQKEHPFVGFWLLAFVSAALPILAGVLCSCRGPSWIASLLAFLGLAGVAAEHRTWRQRPQVPEIPGTSGPLLLLVGHSMVTSFMLLHDRIERPREEGHPLRTLLGWDQGEYAWLLVLSLLSSCAVLAAVSAELARSQRKAPERQGASWERNSLYIERRSREPRQNLRRSCCSQAYSSAERWQCARCFGQVRAFGRSWAGRHCILLANACISTTVCSYQYLQPGRTPRRCFLAVVISQGLLCMATGLCALASEALHCPKRLDRHFRWSVLWKVSMLVGKVILLAIPQASAEIPLDSMMSCGVDAFCPPDCLEGGGYCTRVPTSGAETCKCVKAEMNWAMYCLTAITSFLLCALTFMDLAVFWSARLTPWNQSGVRWMQGSLALLGAALVNLSSCAFTLLVSFAPTKCFLLDLATATCMVLPLLPLSLVANECRWILATWKDGEAGDVLIWSSAGLRVLAVLTCAAVGVSAVQVAWKRQESPEGTCGLVQCGFLAACCLCAPSSLACSLIRAKGLEGESDLLRADMSRSSEQT